MLPRKHIHVTRFQTRAIPPIVMFNWLFAPSETLAYGMEIVFSVGLIVTTLMVVVGLIGEYKEGGWWKRNVRIFEMLVVLGVAGEMITESGAFWYSLRLHATEESKIATLQDTANRSAIKAGELGVTVDNLQTFVRQKDQQVETLVRSDDSKNERLVADLTKYREGLDAAEKTLQSVES